MIKYFDHQGPKVILVLLDMTVSVFEYLEINTWKCIDKRWMFIEKFLNGPYFTKFRNAMLAFKELVRNKAGDQWGLGKLEDVCSDYFWVFCNTNGLGYNGEYTTSKDR